MTPTKLLIGQILIVFAIVTGGIWFATQWAAAHLAYQAELGSPWLLIGETPIYRPWTIFVWWYRYDAYAPHVFDRAGEIAGASGFVGCGAAIDEFPALGRLDFFETSLAFLAGYGVRAFLITQSLNQIEKAYGEHNSILDNCHVRVAFATNDERTAKRISDALGTATEQRSMRNYAGHRLAPWLAHVMVSRQETARALLTPGEAMQLPPTDELVLVSGHPPIRAKKLRYYDDRNFTTRVLPPPALGEGRYRDRPTPRGNDWGSFARLPDARLALAADREGIEEDGGLQQERHPGLPEEQPAHPDDLTQPDPLGLGEDDPDGAADARMMDQARSAGIARTTFGIDAGSARADDMLPGF